MKLCRVLLSRPACVPPTQELHYVSRCLSCKVRVLPLLQVLGVLAHARIADHLATGPKTAAELASLTGAQLPIGQLQTRLMCGRATEGTEDLLPPRCRGHC